MTHYGFDHEDGSCLACSNGHAIPRQGKYGAFYGCSNFPRCRNTESTTIQNRSAGDFFLSADDYARLHAEAFYDGDGH